MRYLILVFLSIWLASCESSPISTPLPTQESIFLAYPPYLQPTADRLLECSSQDSSIAIFLNPIPAAQSSLPGPLIQLQLSGSSLDGQTFFQVGIETISIIINQANIIESLNANQLQEIYSGQQSNWNDDTDSLIQVWTYPVGNLLRTIFEGALPGNPQAASQANIAPDPTAMLAAVAGDTDAIGYLPDSWLDTDNAPLTSQVFKLLLEPSFADKLTQPILAGLMEPITDPLQTIIFCLQNP
jgi:hypothetical protein